jgi:oligopeptidase A
VGHLNGVKNSDELREAYQTMQPKVVGLFQEMGQSQAMYVALKQLSMPENQMTLDSAQKRSK